MNVIVLRVNLWFFLKNYLASKFPCIKNGGYFTLGLHRNFAFWLMRVNTSPTLNLYLLNLCYNQGVI